MKTENRFDLPRGTLDLLIMRVVALGPIHGYAIAQRIQQMYRDALQVQQGSLYPLSIGSNTKSCSSLTGSRLR